MGGSWKVACASCESVARSETELKPTKLRMLLLQVLQQRFNVYIQAYKHNCKVELAKACETFTSTRKGTQCQRKILGIMKNAEHLQVGSKLTLRKTKNKSASNHNFIATATAYAVFFPPFLELKNDKMETLCFRFKYSDSLGETCEMNEPEICRSFACDACVFFCCSHLSLLNHCPSCRRWVKNMSTTQGKQTDKKYRSRNKGIDISRSISYTFLMAIWCYLVGYLFFFSVSTVVLLHHMNGFFGSKKNSASREKRRCSKEAFPGLVLQWWDRPMSQTRKSLHSPVVKADHRNEIKKQRIDFAES